MAYEQKDGQGSLFKNDRKQTANQPDYTGTIMISGQTKRLAAWVKKSQSGVPFMSISISEMVRKEEPAAPKLPAEEYNDLPF